MNIIPPFTIQPSNFLQQSTDLPSNRRFAAISIATAAIASVGAYLHTIVTKIYNVAIDILKNAIKWICTTN